VDGIQKIIAPPKISIMKTPTTSSAGIRVMIKLSTKLTAGDGRPLCENPGHLKREKMIFFGCNHEINVGESEKSWPSRGCGSHPHAALQTKARLTLTMPTMPIQIHTGRKCHHHLHLCDAPSSVVDQPSLIQYTAC
jgi:hypothetical protein